MLPFHHTDNILEKKKKVKKLKRVVFQFEHIFLHGLYGISHPSYCLTSRHAANVLSPAASFCRFQTVPQSHIKELSNVRGTRLPTGTGTGTGFCLPLYCDFRYSKFHTGVTDQLLKAEHPGES